MACIRVDGHEVPVVFPIERGGHAKVESHMLHVRFRFVESSIYLEEKKKSKSGELQQLIPVVKSCEGGGHYWYLERGNYRAYSLPLSLLASSIEAFTRQSDTSTINMSDTNQTILQTSPLQVMPILPTSTVLREIKVERLDPIIELSSELEGESIDITLPKHLYAVDTKLHANSIVRCLSGRPSSNPPKSVVSPPPRHENEHD